MGNGYLYIIFYGRFFAGCLLMWVTTTVKENFKGGTFRLPSKVKIHNPKMTSLSCLLIEDILYTYLFPMLSPMDLVNVAKAMTDMHHIVQGYMSKLKRIDWEYVPADRMEEIADNTRSLKSIDFTRAGWVPNACIETLLKKNRGMENVMIRECPDLKLSGVRPLVNLKHLTVLSVRSNNWVSNRFITMLTSNLEPYHLKKIDFSVCLVSDVVLVPFFEKFKRLTEIELEDCPMITDRTVYAVGENSADLIYFNIGWNRQIGENCVRYVLEKCENLRTMRVFGCIQISVGLAESMLRQIAF